MPRRFPNRSDVRPGRQHPRRPGTYQTRPMRASQEIEIVHTGSGWYEIRMAGEVVEDGIRGEESALEIAEELDG